MRAEIIAIGDELTSGQRLDTNSQWLAERLLESGVPVAFHTTVGDRLDDNVLVFRQACERAEIIVATGGLGPTADDLTRQALAAVAGVSLVQDDESLDHIRSLFARRKREMPAANVIQAQFPEGSRPIPNPHGTAPGIDFGIAATAAHRARVFALPGVPAEMKEMWQATVQPAIQDLIGVRQTIVHHCIKCFGVGESDLEAMLPDLIARDRYPLVGITVHQATITLRITAAGETAAAARGSMEPTITEIQRCLGDLVFGEECDELPDAVARLLRQKGQTLAVRECATSGLITHWMASLEAADVFLGGQVVTEREAWDDMRSMPVADYCLLIGPQPSADSAGQAAGSLPVVLVDHGEPTRREMTYGGHPDILKSRSAKQALNLLRLRLLGKA